MTRPEDRAPQKSLAIGDDKSAILIIQQSQTDPQKALAELIENGIDARANRITITRRKREGAVELVVEDNGQGVKPGADGSPDFDRIARGICDSYKKYLDANAREGIQGEFAIGILGFAAIGGELEMISRTAASPTRGMRLRAGSVEYETFTPRHSLPASGTTVTIRNVRKEIQNRLTADKLSRYLGSELRDRMRASQVEIRIEDKLPRGRSLLVQPRRFEGQKIPCPHTLQAAGGRVRFELYVAGEGGDGRVGVVRRGTRLLDDLCSIEEFAHQPWNGGRVEGLIHFDLLTPAPASRKGIVPDEHLLKFIETVQQVEASVIAFIGELEREKDEETGRALVREVQEVFAAVVNELAADYNWFDGGRGGPLPGPRPGGDGKRKEVRLSRGPLAAVEIVPRLAQVSPGESKKFTAHALDPQGALIPVDVVFSWSLGSPLGSLTAEGPTATLLAGDEEGEGRLSVTAHQGSAVAQAEARFLVLQVKKAARGHKLLLEPVNRPEEPWRSRWVPSRSVIEYNIGHANYIQAKLRGKRNLLRYVALLVAKELVLHNFSGVPQPLVLERMVEVVSALQQRL